MMDDPLPVNSSVLLDVVRNVDDHLLYQSEMSMQSHNKPSSTLL